MATAEATKPKAAKKEKAVDDKKASEETPAEKQEEKPVDPRAETLKEVRDSLALIKKHVTTTEERFSVRALRRLPGLRRKLTPDILHGAITAAYPLHESDKCDVLLSFLGDTAVALDTDEPEGDAPLVEELLPEVELFMHLLVLIYLIDNSKESAVACANALIGRVVDTKRRTSDVIAAKCYFYFARAFELNGQSGKIRSTLYGALRTATLRCDEVGQSVLLNLLLRNYLEDNLVEQAKLLVLKTTFPESASNNQSARYLYYTGRIQAIELEYSTAHRSLVQATRKAPKTAHGFLQTAHKLAVIVQMLLGEIPERELFRRPELKRPLQPYFQLTQAVRIGDLAQFGEALEKYGDTFRADKTYTLILRLHHNVIKTGVRSINLSYSRIPLVEVAAKLQLDSAEDAEYIVAKSIRDGVIDAMINHEEGYVQSKEVVDIYSTQEPHEMFHRRIEFCLKSHNDSVQAMRYPPNAYRKYLETPAQRREREQSEAELATELDEEEGF
eukprot:m.133785 g.133785  ORF g.133785 m.133785 type:complete len:501 (-) comp16895_c1_seq1:177-1679(-)